MINQLKKHGIKVRRFPRTNRKPIKWYYPKNFPHHNLPTKQYKIKFPNLKNPKKFKIYKYPNPRFPRKPFKIFYKYPKH